MAAKKQIEVVAAILENDQKILCVQRDENKYSYISKKYEFPGGKIEVGETNGQALKREILEELCLDIEIESLFLTVEHEYPDFELRMHGYLCKSTNTQNMNLTEHIDYQWLPVSDLTNLDWAAADIPIVKLLQARMHERG